MQDVHTRGGHDTYVPATRCGGLAQYYCGDYHLAAMSYRCPIILYLEVAMLHVLRTNDHVL